MAISDNYVPIRQIGNGVTVAFSSNWNMIAAVYALVYLENASTGVQTAVPPGPGAGQYTLAFSASGFTVTFGTAPTAAQYAVIGRSVAQDQTDPYRTSKGYQGEVLESSLDKLTAMVQDLSNLGDRTLKFQLGSAAVGTLPTPVDDAVLAWSGTGGAVKNGPTTATLLAGSSSAAASAIAAAASASAASGSQIAAAASAVTAGNSQTSAAASAAAAAASALNSANGIGGFVNKFRNPGMQCNNYGNTGGSITAGSPAYCVDGFILSCTGANISWTQSALYNTNYGAVLANYLTLLGAVSVSGTTIKQRIESAVAGTLANQQITFQASITNSTGATFTPTLTVKHPTVADNYTATGTDLNAVSLTPCPVGTTTVSYTLPGPGLSYLGLEFTLDFGGILNSGAKGILTTAWDVRVTPGAATGIPVATPVPELRPYAIEQVFCSRYVPAFFGQNANEYIAQGPLFNTSTAQLSYMFLVEPRLPPTGIIVSSAAHFSLSSGPTSSVVTALTFAQTSRKSVMMNVVGTGTPYTASTAGQLVTSSASARIVFTGADIPATP